MKQLVKLVPNLAVYILMYPLPANPEAYDKSRAVVTFKKQETLDKAFAGGVLPAIGTLDGVLQVNEIISYARKNGITATPSIVLSDGSVLSGFRTAAELKSLLTAK